MSLIASDPGGRRTAAELADAEQIILVEAALDLLEPTQRFQFMPNFLTGRAVL